MKFAYLFIISIVLLASLGVSGCMAGTRVIKGTVFAPNGKPASGVLVTADRTKDKFYTSFDGNYVIKIDPKTTFLKFKFIDREEKLSIVGITGNVINFGKKAELPNTPQTSNPK
jgi:hypothetical protein